MDATTSTTGEQQFSFSCILPHIKTNYFIMALKDFFTKKKTEIKTYEDFWEWFTKNEQRFFPVVKNQSDIERQFFDQLLPVLELSPTPIEGTVHLSLTFLTTL